MSCRPASDQNLKNPRNSGRFCNSPQVGDSAPGDHINQIYHFALLGDTTNEAGLRLSVLQHAMLTEFAEVGGSQTEVSVTDFK